MGRLALLILTTFSLGIAVTCQADGKKPIIVAVIDTGIDTELMSEPWVCKYGHKDFTGTGIQDTHGHGTHIAGLIEQYAKDVILSEGKTRFDLDKAKANFCIVVLKYYDPKAVGSNNLKNTIDAFKWAVDHKVDIINYSGGGIEFSKDEQTAVLYALNHGVKVVAAAGNEHADLTKSTYYPAMYDKRIVVVGNLVSKQNRSIAASSNYGPPVTNWEVGTNVLSRLPGRTFGIMTGTSQSTAIKSGKIVREMLATQEFQHGTRVKLKDNPWSGNETRKN